MTEYSNEGHGLSKKYIDEAIEKIRNESGQPISKEEMINNTLDPYSRIDFENVIELLYRPISSKIREAERMKAQKVYMHKNRSVHVFREDIDKNVKLELGMIDPFEDLAEKFDLKDVRFEVATITDDMVELRILEATRMVIDDKNKVGTIVEG